MFTDRKTEADPLTFLEFFDICLSLLQIVVIFLEALSIFLKGESARSGASKCLRVCHLDLFKKELGWLHFGMQSSGDGSQSFGQVCIWELLSICKDIRPCLISHHYVKLTKFSAAGVWARFETIGAHEKRGRRRRFQLILDSELPLTLLVLGRVGAGRRQR